VAEQNKSSIYKELNKFTGVGNPHLSKTAKGGAPTLDKPLAQGS
jgi:hypothetical protein